jgi:DNA processing protein
MTNNNTTTTLTADNVALMALSQVAGLTAKRLLALLEMASPSQLWQASRQQWHQWLFAKPATPFQADTRNAIINAVLVAQQTLDLADLATTYAEQHIQLITWGSPQYPPLLAQIADPPVLLYCKGNIGALTGNTIGFVGTRHASAYGKQVTKHLIADLALSNRGVCVVSGLAQGIDGIAHQAALDTGLPTVAVFGTGLNKVFPVAHGQLAADIVASGGALLSEYAPNMGGDRFTFPKRNRVIAGLSYGVIVVEGGQKSGSLITARLALDYNRSVFAVPGNLFSPGSAGPHYLLSKGAVLVTHASDMLADLNWLDSAQPQPDPSPATEATDTPPTQLALLADLPDPPTHSLRSPIIDPIPMTQATTDDPLLALIPYDATLIEWLAQQAHCPMERLGPQLTLLELDGLIALLPGAKVCRR